MLKDKIKNFILNLLLTEKEKVLIVETLNDRYCRSYESMTDSNKELSKDLRQITNRLKTKTPGCTWYEIEK